MSDMPITFMIGEDPPPRLDKALARDIPADLPLSRTRLAALVAAGEVSINGAVVTNAKARVSAGDQVTVVVPQAVESHILPEDLPLDIVYEDADLIVINKPAGMVVHPAPGTPAGTLVNALQHHTSGDLSGVGGIRRPGIVHRIDKDTSGLLVVAKSDVAHLGLASQFAEHSVKRHYLALVHGVPDAADPRLAGLKGVRFEDGGVLRIGTEIARHRHDRQRQAVVPSGGRRAVTRARVLERFGAPATLSLLECWLETGRTHQIRVHMAYAGHGLVGDPVYGGKRRASEKALPEKAVAALGAFGRQALHAATLGFVHPVSGTLLEFSAQLPGDMQHLLDTLQYRAAEGSPNVDPVS